MQLLKVDYLVDSLILLLHDNRAEYQSLVKKVIEIFETDKQSGKVIVEKDDNVEKFYIHLLREVMDLGITVDNSKEVDTFLLKFKSNPVLTKDPELFTTLKGIFTDKEVLSDDRKTRIVQRLSNEVLLSFNTRLIISSK